MARDERPEPPRSSAPPSAREAGARDPGISLGPRQMRASLSSSLGLDGGRRGTGRVRVEPRLGATLDDSPQVAADPSLHAGWSDEDEPFEGAVARPNDTVAALPQPTAASTRREPAEPAETSSAARRISRAPAERRGRGKSTEPKKNGKPGDGAPAASAQTIVPPQAVAGRALVSVVAIMCFLACLAVGTLSLVIGAAQDWQLDVSREVTIQVKPVDGAAMTARLAKALEIARSTPGVRSARLIDERESAALLEPWLGQGLDLSSLPIPRLVVLELADPGSADLSGLKRRIGAEVAGALVDDHAVWAARLRTMAGAVVAVGVMIVLLVFVAMVLSVVFATQSAMAGNREVIEVLHFVGAEDSFIARQFQQHFLKLGLRGGAIGGAAAIVCFISADVATRSTRGDALADQAHALFGGFSIGFGGYLAAVAVVGVVAVLTAITSRQTVLGHLRRID